MCAPRTLPAHTEKTAAGLPSRRFGYAGSPRHVGPRGARAHRRGFRVALRRPGPAGCRLAAPPLAKRQHRPSLTCAPYHGGPLRASASLGLNARVPAWPCTLECQPTEYREACSEAAGSGHAVRKEVAYYTVLRGRVLRDPITRRLHAPCPLAPQAAVSWPPGMSPLASWSSPTSRSRRPCTTAGSRPCATCAMPCSRSRRRP